MTGISEHHREEEGEGDDGEGCYGGEGEGDNTGEKGGRREGEGGGKAILHTGYVYFIALSSP